MTEPFEPILTITTTTANVADLKAERHRWACPCGKRGPWVDLEAEAVGLAELHIAGTALIASPACRGVRVESVGVFTGQEQGS